MALSKCFSSLGCPTASLDEVFKIAQRHKVTAVELRALGGNVDLAEYFAREFGSPVVLANMLRTAPVRVVLLATSCQLIGGSNREWENLQRIGPWAEALGVKWLRVFDGGTTADSGEITEAADSVRRWRAIRHQRGWRVDVLVETHGALTNSDAITRFCSASPEAAILWDSHHTWKRSGEDPVTTWRTIGHKVRHIHVKDSATTGGGQNGWHYVLPGKGEFPMRSLIRELNAVGFSGPVSLEWERMWHPELESLEMALASADDASWW